MFEKKMTLDRDGKIGLQEKSLSDKQNQNHFIKKIVDPNNKRKLSPDWLIK